jgi:UDP-glucose 4-epimerase
VVIAVTGAEGFLGKAVTPLLQNAGHQVLPVSRRQGFDIRHVASLEALPHFDAVVHLAAMSYVPDSYQRPAEFFETNVTGTLNVLEAARNRKARMIYISSYVYGQPQYLPIDEAHPAAAFNPYAQTKLMGEELCVAWHRDFEVSSIILRPFNIYGPGQPEHFLLPKIARQYLSGEAVRVFDIRPRRDYVHVQDVADAIVRAVLATNDGVDIVNIGAGASYSIPDVCALLSELTGKELRLIDEQKHRPSEILDTVCDNRKAEALLGWRPRISLKEGLSSMIEYLAAHAE